MHVKLETLRVNLALGVQIYVLEAMKWPEIVWMKMSQLDSVSWKNNSVSLLKISLDLVCLFLDSASLVEES